MYIRVIDDTRLWVITLVLQKALVLLLTMSNALILSNRGVMLHLAPFLQLFLLE